MTRIAYLLARVALSVSSLISLEVHRLRQL